MMSTLHKSTLTAHCRWEDETVRERTGHPPSYAEAKKMKSLTLNTHGCPRARLRDWSSSSSMWNDGEMMLQRSIRWRFVWFDQSWRNLRISSLANTGSQVSITRLWRRTVCVKLAFLVQTLNSCVSSICFSNCPPQSFWPSIQLFTLYGLFSLFTI